MDLIEVEKLAEANRERAAAVLAESGVADVWREAGCRVCLVGSLRMGLLAAHRDIDLHVYSSGITVEDSFAVMAKVVSEAKVREVKCINGLHTDEHCVAWHVKYEAAEGEEWQIDVIHIEEGTTYDGYFERMADRIVEVMTPEQRATILRLKFETPEGKGYHGVEYYEAVIADGVATMPELEAWISDHRLKAPYYWMP